MDGYALKSFREPVRYAWLLPVVLLLLLVACSSHPTEPVQQAVPASAVEPQESAMRVASLSPTRSSLLPANGSAPFFERFSLEEGLSSNLAQAIIQDRQGFIWIGTLEGLNKYDGYRVTIYRPEPGNLQSLSDTVINGVYEDRAGNLWVATTNGLNKFDPATEQFTRYQHDPTDPTSLGHNALSVADGFYEDASGRLWFSSWAGGLSSFDPATEQFTRYQHNPAEPTSLATGAIIKMAPSVDGTRLWLATPAGLGRFDLATGTALFYQHDPANPTSLSYDEVTSVYATSLDGRPVVWAGTGDGQLNQFDPADERFTRHKVANTKITAMYEAADGLLWLGTQGEGILLFEPSTGTVVGNYRNEPGKPGSLSADLVNQIYEDRTGALWIATYTGGVSRLDPQKKPFQLYRHQPDNPHSLSSSNVYAIDYGHDGTLWVGTLDSGLNRLDPSSGAVTRYMHDPTNPHSLSHNIVTDVLEDSRGLVWVATVGGGLNRFDPATERFTHYRHEATNPDSLRSNGVLVLFEDRAGMLWIGTADAGLSRFDPLSERFTHYLPDPTGAGSLSDASIGAIFEDSRGIIWVGTKQGLDAFDPATGRFTNYRHDDNDPHSLSHNYVKSIYEDAAGDLWLATDVGLNRFNRQSGQFKAYFTRDGLPHDQVSSIIADNEGCLWIGTSGGLARFDPRTESFRSYNRHDGLQGDLFYPNAAARAPDGTLYLGGFNGLNAFQPATIYDNPHPPPVVLTGFRLFNELVQPGAGSPLSQQVGFTRVINLTHEQSVFGFEFVALNYTAPANNRYAFMLEGFDQDWSYTGSNQRSARYTNLDPGSYTFRVKASNNDGVWNEQGAAVTIIIMPPWWETFWFRGMVLALLAGGVLGGVQWHVWRSRRRQRWLEAQVEERTRELLASEAALRQAKQAAEAANQAKSAFLAGMSHELRTPLTTIMGYARILRDRAPQDQDLNQGLQRIQRSGDQLLALIDEVLDIARIEAGRVDLHSAPIVLQELLEELAETIRPRARQKGLDFVLATSPEPLAATEPQVRGENGVILPVVVIGDAVRLRQILLNLLTNAVKYTAQGRVTLKVGWAGAQAGRLRFMVEDTGCGIAAGDLERIFEPFQQIRSADNGTDGVGLGLTISRQLVRLMGGELQVASTPGQGSSFWFELLLPVPVEAAVAWEAPRRIIGVEGRQPRVLVVDDSEDNRAVLVEGLTALGFVVAEARDGAEALHRVVELEPEAIIIDLMLPNMAGVELIEQLRRQPTFAQTTIIVCSASVFEEDRRKSLAAGADAFLPKPVKREQLLELLGQHLQLEWRYADEPVRTNGVASTQLPAASLPDQEELARLYHLALMGHAAALQERAAELARLDARLAPFAAEVERRAHRLQMNELSAFLERYLER